MQSGAKQEPEKLHLNWTHIEGAVSYIVQKLGEYNYKPERILAVARGGLIPATMLSHRLGVPLVLSIQLKSYSEQGQQEFVQAIHTEHLLDLRSRYNDPGTLIVDDLWDTGKTHEFLKEHFPEAVFTTTFYKDRGDDSHRIVNYPGLDLPQDCWVVFPWERDQ